VRGVEDEEPQEGPDVQGDGLAAAKTANGERGNRLASNVNPWIITRLASSHTHCSEIFRTEDAPAQVRREGCL
jgi:hypothetical protein